MSNAWKYLNNELMIQVVLRKIQIHAFVLMPNHFHLLLTTPESNLDIVMREWMGSTTRIVNTRSRRSGHLYGGRYYWSVIQDPLYFAHAYKYVYRNPVKSGHCKNVEDFEFSTFQQLIGLQKPTIPLTMPELGHSISHHPFQQLEWLNHSYSSEESEAIRKALHKKEFKIPINRITRKPFHIAI